MSQAPKEYNRYKEIALKAADLYNASAVLSWDQETYMPPKSADIRGRQLSTLAGIAHELLTSETYGNLLESLLNDERLTEAESNNIRISYEDYQKNKKLSASFVEELSLCTSSCFNAWIKARQDNDFSIFAPHLEQMIALKRRQAELLGYEVHPYDALLDEYEKGMTVAQLDPIFEKIKQTLPSLLNKIKQTQQVNDDFLNRHYPKQQQWDFSVKVLTAMGYDWEAGRQDYAEHPFTTSFSPTDVRITTRVDEQDYASLLWSSIHEGGHALYEQGLTVEEYGLPLSQAASLGIHESQSRLWENCIGRSHSYWQHFYPLLQQTFPEQLTKVSLQDFYNGINKVQPSLIRTEADEVTYHFHVLIRYEIEKRLIEGSLSVDDLPKYWNALYEQYLSVTAPDYKQGVLQDVHWSHGSFGYFPTYSLGSFYAVQFYNQALQDNPGLSEEIAKGNTTKLLVWLRDNIHCYGRRFTSEELCKRITGRGLDIEAFLSYATQKYALVYGFRE